MSPSTNNWGQTRTEHSLLHGNHNGKYITELKMLMRTIGEHQQCEFIRKTGSYPKTHITLCTIYRTKTTNRELKRWVPSTPPKTRGWKPVLAKVNQFLLLIRHPTCCSYILSGPIKIFSTIEDVNGNRYIAILYMDLSYRETSSWFPP